MHSAVESSIGLPSRATSASRMLVFVTPPDVRRSFKLPPDFVDVGENVLALTDPCAVETGRPAKTHRPVPASLVQGTVRLAQVIPMRLTLAARSVGLRRPRTHVCRRRCAA